MGGSHSLTAKYSSTNVVDDPGLRVDEQNRIRRARENVHVQQGTKAHTCRTFPNTAIHLPAFTRSVVAHLPMDVGTILWQRLFCHSEPGSEREQERLDVFTAINNENKTTRLHNLFNCF